MRSKANAYLRWDLSAYKAQAGAEESTQVEGDNKGIKDYGVRVRQSRWQANQRGR
jgi:hypothetical protein